VGEALLTPGPSLVRKDDAAVGRCLVQHDEIHAAPEHPLTLTFEFEARSVKSRRRMFHFGVA